MENLNIVELMITNIPSESGACQVWCRACQGACQVLREASYKQRQAQLFVKKALYLMK